jgi:hypothetical protein
LAQQRQSVKIFLGNLDRFSLERFHDFPEDSERNGCTDNVWRREERTISERIALAGEAVNRNLESFARMDELERLHGSELIRQIE